MSEKTFKVFIADDSALFRSVLASSITGLTGAEVVGEADTFEQAILSILALQPDVVILNLHLNTGTAVDVLQGIRKVNNEAPIVIMLANHHYNLQQKSRLGHGAEYFFHKASEFGNIASVIKTLMTNGKPKRQAREFSVIENAANIHEGWSSVRA